jgi:hypothetical protein
MTDGNCVVMFVLGAGAATAAGVFVTHQTGLRRRTIDEVADFLLDPDKEKLLLSFNPALDTAWRTENDRRLQRVRLALFYDCLAFMLRNVRVLFEWADTERFDNEHLNLNYSSDLVSTIENVIGASQQFLRAGRWLKWKVTFLMLTRFEILPFMPVPNLSPFRNAAGIDLLDAYRAVAEAAEALALAHGDVEAITARIRVCFWTA